MKYIIMKNKTEKKEYQPPIISREDVLLENGIAVGSYVSPSGAQENLPSVESWEDNTDNTTLWI